MIQNCLLVVKEVVVESHFTSIHLDYTPAYYHKEHFPKKGPPKSAWRCSQAALENSQECCGAGGRLCLVF